MILAIALFLATIALGWANGANDVSKGVAALAGSGVTSPRSAWLLGVAGTAAGGGAAIYAGEALSALFGGGFLRGASMLGVEAAFAALVGATGFVLTATWMRWPVSTTHALIGGVVGAALIQFGPEGVAFNAILAGFAVPLLLSPLMAIALCWILIQINRVAEAHIPHWTPGCCEQEEWRRDPFVCAPATDRPPLVVRRAWLSLHWVSAGAVSFARGMNDTPKIAALMIPAFAYLPAAELSDHGPRLAVVAIALAMTIGGLMAGRRILPILAKGVSSMNASTGLFANIGTAFLVLAATPLGYPVSTTHVATGSLIGVRVAGHAPVRSRDALRVILLAWLVTLPAAGVAAALTAHFLVG